MDVELDFETVRERWLAAGGNDTGGIIGWFEQVVERWVESEIPTREVAELRFIGAEAAGGGPPSPAAATALATSKVSRRVPAFAGTRTGG